MNQDEIYRTYWASVNALSASTHLRGVDEKASLVLLKISRLLCQRLTDAIVSKPKESNEIKEEIQRYVDEIRSETSDK